MNTLDANKLFEMDLLSHHNLCLNLILVVAEGHEVVTWGGQDKEFFSVSDDGEEKPLLPIDDKAIRSHMLESLTRAVETLAFIEGIPSNTGLFLLSLGEHQIKVGVEGMAANSPNTITLRMTGAKGVRERARAMLRELVARREKTGPMILSYDGERILGHGTLRLKYRIAELMKWVFVLVWYAFWVGLICVLFALTPLASTLGFLGWIACVELGLCLALAISSYVFGRCEHV